MPQIAVETCSPYLPCRWVKELWWSAMFFPPEHCAPFSSSLGIAVGVERSIISHERDGKWYRVSPYFLGKMVAEIFMAVVLPLIYLLVCYWMVSTSLLFDHWPLS